VRVFKTIAFAKFARKQRIVDVTLCEAVSRALRGQIDASLGGQLIKQRVPRQGQGRSGGFRTIIALKLRERAVFLYGFAKNNQDNISSVDLSRLKILGAALLEAGRGGIEALIADGEIFEVVCDGEEISK